MYVGGSRNHEYASFPQRRRNCRQLGIIISAPREITDYERNAFYESAQSLGFATVAVIDESVSAALGSDIPIFSPSGQMLVDLGSGITEAIVTSSGGVVGSRSVRMGGNDLDDNIVQFLINQHHFSIAHGLARTIKERYGFTGVARQSTDIEISGRCLKKNLPRKKTIQTWDFKSCIDSYVERVEKLILELLEKTEPELVSDILDNGIWLSGGAALLHGLPEDLTGRLKITIRRVDDPLRAVAVGSGKVVNNPAYADLCRFVH